MSDHIQVEVRIDDGQPRPAAFTWNGRRFDIYHHGRQWDEGDGHHFLVMTQDRRPFELVHSDVNGSWRLAKSPVDFGGRPAMS